MLRNGFYSVAEVFNILWFMYIINWCLVMAINGKMLMILAAVIVVVAILVVFVGRSSSPSSTNKGSTFNTSSASSSQKTSLSVSPSESSAYTTLSSKKNIGFESLLNYVTDTNSTNSTPIMIDYKGTASGTYSVLSLDFPINLEYANVNNNWRLKLNATSIPLFGNITAYSIYKNGTLYSCSQNTVYNDSGRSVSTQCRIEKNNSISGISVSSLSNYNIKINKISESSYNGIPCLFVSGNADNITTPESSNSTVPSNYNANINVSTCIYTQYRLPLNLSINMTAINKTNSNQKITLNLKLNEVSIVNNVNQTYVDTLPGPIVNSTSLSTFNNSNGNNGGSTNLHEFNNACNQTVFLYVNKGYAICGNYKVVLVSVSSENITTPYSTFNIYNNETGTLIMAGLSADLFQTSDITYNNVTLDIYNAGTFNMTGLQDSAIRLSIQKI